MDHYDAIFAGGGGAGLSLAYRIARSSLSRKRILIIDPLRKDTNDRTWCYWSVRDELFDPLVAHRWNHLWFHGPQRSHRFSLAPYSYRMIHGADFYRHTLHELEENPNVDFLTARVESIRDGETRSGTPATVTTDGGKSFHASWVFDSRFLPREFTVDTRRYHFLKQHFVGWTIQTDSDTFDDGAVTMFDLRVPLHGDFRFMYILPLSPRKALIEYTLFSERLLERHAYEREIREYITRYYPTMRYEVVETEDGIIPMTEQPFPRQGGERIMYIGTKGGRVKASTGFAFLRTQRDSERIVTSLIRNGHPFHRQEPPKRYRTFDAMLLSLLARRGGYTAERVFVDLFERNPLPRLWRFLDEEGSLRENIALMATVPWAPFIAAYVRVKAGALFGRRG